MEEQFASSKTPDQTSLSPYADCPAVMKDADLPNIPPSDTYDPVSLSDPMFLHTEISKLWEVHKQYDGGIKVERTKMLAADKNLGELLYAMKALLATVGRAGRWSAYLRSNGFSRATADRLVARFEQSLNPNKSPHEAIYEEPSEVDISKLSAVVWRRVEPKLPTLRSRFDFLRCVLGLSGLTYQHGENGVLVLDPMGIPPKSEPGNEGQASEPVLDVASATCPDEKLAGEIL